MAQDKLQFEEFLESVNPVHIEGIKQIHGDLMENGCDLKITLAKSGYVVSYHFLKTKRVLLNYVFRKKGMFVRVYGDYINEYTNLLETLPPEMAMAIDKAPVCRRMADPAKCNSRCPMGYDFTIGENHYQKCRYSAFMFLVNEISLPYIKSFIACEIKART